MLSFVKKEAIYGGIYSPSLFFLRRAAMRKAPRQTLIYPPGHPCYVPLCWTLA